MDTKTTYRGYMNIRKFNKETSTSNCFKLQDLVDHTIQRFLNVLPNTEETGQFTLRWKWGLDGLSGFHKRNQKPSNTNDRALDAYNQSVVVVAFSPLDLRRYGAVFGQTLHHPLKFIAELLNSCTTRNPLNTYKRPTKSIDLKYPIFD